MNSLTTLSIIELLRKHTKEELYKTTFITKKVFKYNYLLTTNKFVPYIIKADSYKDAIRKLIENYQTMYIIIECISDSREILYTMKEEYDEYNDLINKLVDKLDELHCEPIQELFLKNIELSINLISIFIEKSVYNCDDLINLQSLNEINTI